MLVENTTVTVTAGRPEDVEAALARIAAYLESSAHCAGYLLTRDLAPADRYLLSATWDAPRWRGMAWRYFADALAARGVEYRADVSTRRTAEAEVAAAARRRA
jgi:hypothetical protein